MKRKTDEPLGRESGILGIDAGGTFTDVVFVSGDKLEVKVKKKTPTYHDDLMVTIRDGLDLILQDVEASQIRAVNLATTLATNAIVENKLRPVGLILIGYDDETIRKAIQRDAFSTQLIAKVQGGHSAKGEEVAPLDEEAVIDALKKWGPSVEGFAISSYFSVRNPSHEMRALQLAAEYVPDIKITCGHELATELDAVKRATTAVLNAGLIPIVMELLVSVEEECTARGINAPITIVRGDGSLVSAEWAKDHPVEMILSGPAGSACGASYLAGASEQSKASWAIDIGGTTTDIIRLDSNGKPLITGFSTVAHHKTLVRAIDIETFGLGGDSRVHYDLDQNLTLGPRRVKPLCVAASEDPEVLHVLSWHVESEYIGEPLVVFRGKAKPDTPLAERVVERLSSGPQMIDTLLEKESMYKRSFNDVLNMEARGIVNFAGFTPTDALHVVGLFDRWDREASILGAKIMIRDDTKDTPESFANMVRNKMAEIAAARLFTKSFSIDGLEMSEHGEGREIIKLAFRKDRPESAQIRLILNASLIGLGAPAWAFIKPIGELLDEQSILPEHAEVAGAVGAAVGTFSLEYAVRIVPRSDGLFRAHHPLGYTDYEHLEDAVRETEKFMNVWLDERARKAGASNPEISCERVDEKAWISGGTHQVYLWTQLTFSVSDKVS